MTPAEFRAWLDGFSEAVEGAPTPEQWAKIKAKMAEVREPIINQLPPVLKAWPGGTEPCGTGRWQPSIIVTN